MRPPAAAYNSSSGGSSSFSAVHVKAWNLHAPRHRYKLRHILQHNVQTEISAKLAYTGVEDSVNSN